MMIATSEARLLAEPLAVPTDELVSAFDTLRSALLNALHSMLGSREDAEDALQMSFIRCWQARAALPQIRNLRAWVWRISLNVGRDLLDYSRRRRCKSLSSVESPPLCPAVSPLDVLAVQEDEERLHAALDSLRAEEKEVFLLRQKKSLSYEEISQLRGSPVGSVKTLMHGAVQKLRGMLHESAN
jgi:RNA polymerase sigma-70 factor, ECF subfamily